MNKLLITTALAVVGFGAMTSSVPLITSAAAQQSAAVPLCSKTILDNCMNPSQAHAKKTVVKHKKLGKPHVKATKKHHVAAVKPAKKLTPAAVPVTKVAVPVPVKAPKPSTKPSKALPR